MSRDSTSQQRRGRETRKRILGAARRLFALNGEQGTSLDDLLRESDVGKGAFYHHFPSKQAVLLELMAGLEAEYERELFDVVVAEAEPKERLRAALQRWLVLQESGTWLNCRLVATLSTGGRLDDPVAEAVRQTVRMLLERWSGLIRETLPVWVAARKGRAATTSQWVLNTLLGCLVADGSGFKLADRRRVVEMLADTLSSRGKS